MTELDDVDMTPGERAMLQETHDALMELRAALLSVPVGAGKDERPLLEDIRTVVKAYQRATWATRAVIWFLPALAGLGVAFQVIRGWFPQ